MNINTGQSVYNIRDATTPQTASFFLPVTGKTENVETRKSAGLLVSADGRVLWASSEFCASLHVGAAEVRGMRLQDIVSAADEQVDLLEVLRSESASSIHCIFYPKNAFPEMVLLSGESSKNESGEVVDMMLTIEELRLGAVDEAVGGLVPARSSEEILTENEALSRALKEAKAEIENVKESNQSKSAFLANMSHEIRTPMNAVIGFCDLLQHTKLDGDQSECVDAIQSSGEILLQLINQILDYSKIDLGAIDLYNEEIDLKDLLEEVRSILAGRARIKGIELYLDYEGLEHRSFIGDALRVRQVLMNLVSNAIKFTRHGFVKVSLSSRLDFKSGKSSILCTVEDTGIGIASENLKSVFDPFVQANVMVNKEFGGTGLGLAICRTLCKAMGGDIKVESTLGVGTTFSFEIKLSVPEKVMAVGDMESEGASLSRRTPLCSARKILVVDDNYNNLVITNKLAEHLGYEVELAKNGLEAIEILKKGRFDIVLMDVRMSPVDGLETARDIRASAAGDYNKDVYIIALTANALQGDRECCIEAGMNDYLAKPLNLTKLGDSLKRAENSLVRS